MSLKRICIYFIMLSLGFVVTACNMLEENIDKETGTSEGNQETDQDTDTGSQFELPNVHLQKKATGDDVASLQEGLNQIGYELEVTGEFDENTTWAVTDLQLQEDDLLITGMYTSETFEVLNEYILNEQIIEPGAGLPYEAQPVTTNEGSVVVGNPYDVLSVINKERALSAEYAPEDLVVPDVPFPFTEDLPKRYMREPAARALETLFEAADQEGLDLYAQSGYRSYERQDEIFTRNANEHGEEHANTYSARPGESEHQTGLAMDVTTASINFEINAAFGDTEEGAWIVENAAQFGFIIRYPEGKEDITLYQYEPWHLRYVGEEAAEEISKGNLTLEEYFDL